MADDLLAAAMADMKSALSDAAVPKPRKPKRRPTKENIISVQNLLSGTDGFGVKIKILTAGQQRERCAAVSVSEYKYEGGTIPSDEEGLRLPGKLRHGHGEMSDEVGNRYVGEWVNDKRSGKGVYTFASGDVYEGQWLDGMYHGYGKYTSAESDEYEGEWQQDKMSGKGKYRYRDLGDVYEGDWNGGLREGFGKYTCADGTVFIGQYEAGELVKKIKINAEHITAGTDALGNRLMFFSATQTCHEAREAGLDKFIYEGDSLASEQEGLKTPGQMRHGHGEETSCRPPPHRPLPHARVYASHAGTIVCLPPHLSQVRYDTRPAPSTRASGRMTSAPAPASSRLRAATCTRASGPRTSTMAMASTRAPRPMSTRASGATTRCTGRAGISSARPATCTRVATWTASGRARARTRRPTGRRARACGRVASS